MSGGVGGCAGEIPRTRPDQRESGLLPKLRNRGLTRFLRNRGLTRFSYNNHDHQYIFPMPIGVGRPAKHQRTTFGDRLAAAREAAGLTQVQLAHKLGTTQRVITYWERGTVALRADQLRSLADALGVSTDYLLGRENGSKTRGGPVGKMRQIFEEASRLSRGQQQHIIRVLEPFVDRHSNGHKQGA